MEPPHNEIQRVILSLFRAVDRAFPGEVALSAPTKDWLTYLIQIRHLEHELDVFEDNGELVVWVDRRSSYSPALPDLADESEDLVGWLDEATGGLLFRSGGDRNQ